MLMLVLKVYISEGNQSWSQKVCEVCKTNVKLMGRFSVSGLSQTSSAPPAPLSSSSLFSHQVESDMVSKVSEVCESLRYLEFVSGSW